VKIICRYRGFFLKTRYLLRKAGQALLTYLIINMVVFILPRVMPGNYVDYIASTRYLPQEAVRELYAKFGLDEPLYVQFIKFAINVMITSSPDFGYSYYFYPLRAIDVVYIYLPWTLLLLSIATITTFLLGVFLGLIASYYKETAIDRIITSFAIFTMSTPYFVVSLLILLIFAVYLKILPAGGAYTPTLQPGSISFILDVMKHMVLPIIAISIGTSGIFIIMTREIILSNMLEGFFTTAYAIGIGRAKILIEYALKPGILPLITLVGIRFGTMLSGALLTEIIYSYPGLGYILYQAILSKDFPVLQSLFYIMSIMIIIASLILDLIYTLLDPRIRRG